MKLPIVLASIVLAIGISLSYKTLGQNKQAEQDMQMSQKILAKLRSQGKD